MKYNLDIQKEEEGQKGSDTRRFEIILDFGSLWDYYIDFDEFDRLGMAHSAF